jgi:hypothetical protein
MTQTKKIVFLLLLGFSFLGVFVFGFCVINTMVSLKYETNNPTDCVSLVTGKDLCFSIKVLKGLTVACVVLIIFLGVFRKRFLSLL